MNSNISLKIKETSIKSKNIVLFVAVLTNDGLREHIEISLKAWRDENIHVILIIQADSIESASVSIRNIQEYADEIWIRPNKGYDFSAWGEHISRLSLSNKIPSGRIYLTNDSTLGPINKKSFGTMLKRIDESSIDVIALTDNHDNGHHLQSYFLSLSKSATLNPNIQNFFSNIEDKTKIDEVVTSYEIPFGSIAQASGLSISVVFPASQSSDPTIFEASELLLRGYPFIKRKCLLSAKHLTDTQKLLTTIKQLDCSNELINYIKLHTQVENISNENKNLFKLYQDHTGKVSDKWNIYLKTYNRLFKEIINKPLRMLEIGIQNGGSLEIWEKYFNNVELLIGCDIDPRCNNLFYDSNKISIIVGDANTYKTEMEIENISKHFNLIIDDGSHTSADIIKSFCKYFPKLDDDGIFIIEDLHCSYFPSYEGGLGYELSSIEFFKLLADIVNFEHWGVATSRVDRLEKFTSHYGCNIDESVLSNIHSIELVNSICIIRKMSNDENILGERIVAGNVAAVDSNPLLLKSKNVI